VVVAMPTTPVHEEMQQRAGDQEQVRQDAENVSGVLGEEKKRDDREKRDQHQPSP
jgi:hypothetical protein